MKRKLQNFDAVDPESPSHPPAFKMSQRQLHAYRREELEQTLTAFNHAQGSSFYLLDYFHKKIVVESSASLILCGYSKEDAEKEGFDFFKKILSGEEKKWLYKVAAAGYQFFFLHSVDERKNLVLTYDVTMTTQKKSSVLLHHKLIPYKMCRNGNLWLALCNVSLAAYPESGRPTIFNRKTGERYVFLEDQFVREDTSILTNEDMTILGAMIKGLSDRLICERLAGMSLTNFKRRKRVLYEKLGAATSGEAIYKAHLMGII